MIDVFISDPFVDHVKPQLLESAAAAVLNQHDVPEGNEMTVLVEDDDRLRELNAQFLGIDAPTDVLSFPSNELDPETGNQYLGDIIISYPRALAQAQSAGHPVESELQLLVVHGTLHLLGYDHGSDEEKQAMWSVQAKILDKMGVALNRISDD